MTTTYDMICVGAGPTGLACAMESKRAGMRAAVDVFVWKKKEVAATAERLKELELFRAELVGLLEMTGRA